MYPRMRREGNKIKHENQTLEVLKKGASALIGEGTWSVCFGNFQGGRDLIGSIASLLLFTSSIKSLNQRNQFHNPESDHRLLPKDKIKQPS